MAGFVHSQQSLATRGRSWPQWVTQNGFHLRHCVIWVDKSLIAPEVQGGAHLWPCNMQPEVWLGTGHPTPLPRLLAGCGSWSPASLPATLSFLSPLSYSPPSPSPHLWSGRESPTGKVSLTSWVTGALQLFGSLFGRTSQRCLGLLEQPTSH